MINKVKKIDRMLSERRGDKGLRKVKTQPNVAYDIFLSSL